MDRTDRQPARRRVLVIGAGVIGLTTALLLRRRGFETTILADRFAPHVTSVVAGALWEWPPAVCGHEPHDLERLKGWSEKSYRRFTELSADTATGVHLRPVTFYFRRPVTGDPFQERKMNELAARVRGFRHDAALIAENGVAPGCVQDAHRHLAPMIDTDRYLPWLLAAVRDEGCELVSRRIDPPLAESAARLLAEFRVEAIVNCTGLGARDLAADPAVYPLRGAIVRIRNDGRMMPRIEQAHCVSHDGSGPGFIFIVPRGNDRLVVGGFAEPHKVELDIGFANYAPIRDMFRRCVEFLPVLANAELDDAEPVRVGLRPARESSVRLEWDDHLPILHNYGHGGSGVTYSWGCAEEAVERMLSQAPSRVRP